MLPNDERLTSENWITVLSMSRLLVAVFLSAF